MQDVPWLELVKIAAGLSTPLLVAWFGYVFNNRLKALDNTQAQTRRIVDKRIAIYELVAPDLNRIYCFLRFVGYWKEIAPPQMLEAKRALDKAFNINRYLMTADAYAAYDAFVHTAFMTFTGRGRSARIKGLIASDWGDRRTDLIAGWEEQWDAWFVESEAEPATTIDAKYDALMRALTRGFNPDDERRDD